MAMAEEACQGVSPHGCGSDSNYARLCGTLSARILIYIGFFGACGVFQAFFNAIFSNQALLWVLPLFFLVAAHRDLFFSWPFPLGV